MSIASALRSPKMSPKRAASILEDDRVTGELSPGSFLRRRRRRCRRNLDPAVIIQIQRQQLPVGLAEGEAVEPELVVFGMGEPAPGLLLLEGDDDAADFVGPGAISVGDLLGGQHADAGLEVFVN